MNSHRMTKMAFRGEAELEQHPSPNRKIGGFESPHPYSPKKQVTGSNPVGDIHSSRTKRIFQKDRINKTGEMWVRVPRVIEWTSSIGIVDIVAG